MFDIESEESMSVISEELERVKNLLEANLEEMKKIQCAELAMRELCECELETTYEEKMWI